MFEKVNPSHPDKVADRIAGAIVDLAYTRQADPKVAVEVLIGHDLCTIMCESSVPFTQEDVEPIVDRIVGKMCQVELISVNQDVHLASNQNNGFRCGDNGIFKGVPVDDCERDLSTLVRDLYKSYPYDGKYVLTNSRLIACQSNVISSDFKREFSSFDWLDVVVNPLGDWTGGIGVDCGATNRKLGSDMAKSVTGGGLHGKDLSKADVSVNIYAFLKAQELGVPITLCCAIGDDAIDDKPYSEIVEIARGYIKSLGGFEQFACWGLV